jgi:hypothetical protein
MGIIVPHRPSKIQLQRSDSDATQTLPNNVETEVQFLRAFVRGNDWTWSSATGSSKARAVYQGPRDIQCLVWAGAYMITDVAGGLPGFFGLRLYKNAGVFINGQANTLSWAEQQVQLPFEFNLSPGDSIYFTIKQVTTKQMLIDSAYLLLLETGFGADDTVLIT